MKYIILNLLLVAASITYAETKMDVDKYIKASMEGLQIQADAHMNTWGIGKSDTWNVDQNKALIWWTFPDGKIASAPVQIIGTFNPNDGSFMWGWDHPSIQPPLQEHAKLVKVFGEKHKIKRFTTQKVKATEAEAWEFLAVANRLAKSNGGYRADAGGPFVFMTYGEITLKKDKP